MAQLSQRKLPVIVATTLLFVMCVAMIRTTFLEQKQVPITVPASSTSLNHSKLSYSWNTITETTSLARHSSTDNVTELIPPTGWEAHVGSKQSLPTVPSIPADMPFPKSMKSREELQKTECVSTLYNFLLSLDKFVSPHVNMVFGDSKHTNLVLNWIIAALLRLEPPLHNVMVISLDRLLCDTLAAKKLPLTCIVVSVECIFVSSSQHADWRKKMMVRQPVLRLINYWGYDVAAYDSDAVLLRNPQPLYEERPHVSLLASSGTMPDNLSREWGFALCAGTLILRASPSIESLWNHVHSVTRSRRYDQISWNYSLRDTGVVWKKTTDVKNICSEKNGWESKGALNIFVFPQQQFCRGCCKPTMPYKTLYLVHPNADIFSMMAKEKALSSMHAWFLKSSWKHVNNSGMEWLRNVSTL